MSEELKTRFDDSPICILIGCASSCKCVQVVCRLNTVKMTILLQPNQTRLTNISIRWVIRSQFQAAWNEWNYSVFGIQ